MLDLWPDTIQTTELRTPVDVLVEQASLLGQKTRNLVEAEVDTMADEETLLHQFFITVPTLNYHYRLFAIEHDVDLYPLRFIALDEEVANEIPSRVENGSSNGETMEPTSRGRNQKRDSVILRSLPRIENEEQFIKILGEIFRAKRTLYIIGALRGQLNRYKLPLEKFETELDEE